MMINTAHGRRENAHGAERCVTANTGRGNSTPPMRRAGSRILVPISPRIAKCMFCEPYKRVLVSGVGNPNI